MQPRIAKINFSTGGGLVAILLWSATIAMVRSSSEQLGPLTAAAAVYLTGGVLGLLRLGVTNNFPGNLRQLPRKYLLGCGGMFLLYTVLLFLAVGLARGREQALEIALIHYLWPALTVLFSVVLLGQRAGALLAPGTVLGVTGIFLVMTHGASLSWASVWDHWQSNPAAYALALAAAVVWALYSNLARIWSSGSGEGGAVEWFITATGLVLLGLCFCVTEPAVWSFRAIVEVGVLGVITSLAYAFWELAMRRGNMLLVAACSYFIPLLSTLVSCAYLKVRPGPKLWVGCLLLVAGSLLSWRSVSEPLPANDTEAQPVGGKAGME